MSLLVDNNRIAFKNRQKYVSLPDDNNRIGM